MIQQQQQSSHVIGWLLLALREAMGDPEVRLAILQQELGNIQGVEYGKTFEYGFTLAQLQKYLQKIVVPQGQQYHLFTAQNLPDKRSRETHYQTYIVDYGQKKLWVIDPARTPTGKGIYVPYISMDVIIPFFEQRGWTASFAPTTNACQRGLRDVFCQSWSLFLQIEFLKMLLTRGGIHTMQIPSKKEVRYHLLLDFYHRALQIPQVCQQVKISYDHLIRTHRDLVQGVDTPQEKKAIRQAYLKLDPCRLLLQMNVADLE